MSMIAAALSTVVLGLPAVTQVQLPQPVRETINRSCDGSCWPRLVQLPDGDPTAIVLYLHGHYGDEYQGMTEGIYNDVFGRLRRECLPRRWAYVTAHYGGNTWMGPLAEEGVAEVVEALRARWPGRPLYLIGGSMGGTSALIFAQRRPDLVDGVVALCPAADIQAYYEYALTSADPTLANIASAIRIHYTEDGHDLTTELAGRSTLLRADRLTMPAVIGHGDADSVIPIEPTRRLVQALRGLGSLVLYTEYPGGGHDKPVTDVDWTAALDFVSARR